MKLDFLKAAFVICFAYGCATDPARVATTTAADEVRERSRQLVIAEAAKDFETAVSFWLPDAVVHLQGAEAIRGVAAIRNTYPQFFQPIRSFRAEIENVIVASSGDLAYETGTNYFTVESSSGLTDLTSKYLAVWKRSPEGSWHVAAISLTNNPPK